MTTFNPEKGIIIVDAKHVDALHRVVSGPINKPTNLKEATELGFVELGIVDSYGLTAAAIPVLRGQTNAIARYSSTRIDLEDELKVRDIRIFLSTPTATVERPDNDGVHIYAVDDEEVPHVALANSHLRPRPNIIDGPATIPASFIETLRTGDTSNAEKLMKSIGKAGPSESTFAQDARKARLTLATSYREELGDDGWLVTRHITTIASSGGLYQVICPLFGPKPPKESEGHYELEPIMATQVWGMITNFFAIEPIAESYDR